MVFNMYNDLSGETGAKLSSSQAAGSSVSPPESSLLPGRSTSPPLAVIGQCSLDGPTSWNAGVFCERSRLLSQTLTTALRAGICDLLKLENT